MTVLRVATYNCMNFFDQYEGSSAKIRKGKELERLGGVVYRTNADVLALQEIQNDVALDELRDELASMGDSSYRYGHVVRGNYWRKLSIGFLSRRPLNLTSHASLVLPDEAGSTIWEHRSPDDAREGWLYPLRFRRDLLLAEFQLGQRTLAIFNHHLKSRSDYPWLNTSEATIRTAESRASARIVRAYMQANPGALVVVAGDLNHRRNNSSVRALTMDLGFLDPVQRDLVPGNRRLSTYWKKSSDRIDYVLISDASAYIDGSAHVYRSAAARVASDHYCVSIDLEV